MTNLEQYPSGFHPQLFNEKVVLVTGGRSGIGYKTAELLLDLGAHIIIASRNEEKLKQAQAKLEKSRKSEQSLVVAYPCDIRDTQQIKQLAEQINSHFGRLDVLVNNAGGQFPALAEMITDKGWEAVINNNLNGTFYVTREMAQRFFIPQSSGAIVNVIAGISRGFPGMVHTGAARAGVENLSKTLAQEWASHGIRLNCVAPGIIESSGLDTYPPQVRALLDQAKEGIPLARLGTCADVAHAICFLASELATYVSGTTLYVDGAQHLNFDQLGLIKAIKAQLALV